MRICTVQSHSSSPSLFNNFPALPGLVDLSVSASTDEQQEGPMDSMEDEETARFSRIVLQLRDPATGADLGEVKVLGSSAP